MKWWPLVVPDDHYGWALILAEARGRNGRIVWQRVDPNLKERLSEEQNHRCCHCGFRMNETTDWRRYATFDHVIPLGRNGRDIVTNLVIACWECNTDRGHALPGHWGPRYSTVPRSEAANRERDS